ncbi:MAG: periplasmic heavy metal sensor [Deltaproteobacteria bacterium]|nr:periplasmic heavy metal sensor [Deltaproteobacteria bacterium]MBW2158088.1 periplasmic heavy metal sensor [Deltaproteobacteria bacterium]MBW2198129.1 periplasmic heavy metal sensor [Deltaproteobacteria bacterium]MBW2227754.1 periplasmic heavy metal sensor [Deltaproteobacteria bacterium]MBW2327281.1 periplasmic heavy metal sensor [Deltaproteobacteria bacterium]
MRNVTSKLLVVLTVFAVVGFGVYAFADGGMGYGQNRGGWDHHGPGWRQGGSGCPGYGGYMRGDLNDEEVQEMDQQRKAFYKANEDLKQNVYQKWLELESEFAKKTPDAKKAAGIQKEISDLQAQIDQNRVGHIIEMKKINPNVGRGFRGNGPMRYDSFNRRPCRQ